MRLVALFSYKQGLANGFVPKGGLLIIDYSNPFVPVILVVVNIWT
jgi:hypothetical protein